MADENRQIPFYDVIIVGSGPAGGSAAYFLAEAGKRVLVLEKERLPRYKTCGGGLSVRFLREQFPFPFESIQKDEARAVSYIFGDQETTIPIASDAIGLVMRDDFDAYLLRHTRAEVVQQAKVQRLTELRDRVLVETQAGQSYAASYLIGADGANSTVAHLLGLRQHRTLAAAIEAEVPVSPEVKRRFEHQLAFIFGDIHYGYLWIFSKPDHLSVGIGALHPKPGELQKTLKTVMARYGISLDGAALHGHPIPIYTRRERISSIRTLLVGDAAGLADPFSGEGIRFAIKSGRLAAESILSGYPEQYPKNLYRAIGLNHTLTTLVALLFYFFQYPFLFFGTANPFSTQGIVEMLADRMTVITFLLYGLFTLPVFIGTELTAMLLDRLGQARLADRLRAAVYPEAVSASYHTS